MQGASPGEQWLSPGRQCAVTGEAKDKIELIIAIAQGHQGRIGEMAIAAQDDVGVWPGLTQPTQHPPDNGGVLASGGSLAGAQDSGNEFARQALKEEQG